MNAVLPDDMQRDWEAFVEQYVTDYAYDMRIRLARNQPQTVSELPPLNTSEMALFKPQAQRNAQLLHEIAFGKRDTAAIIEAHLPAGLKPAQRRGAVEKLLSDLTHITSALSAQSEAEEPFYELQRFTLRQLMQKWGELREDAARAVGAKDFRMPRRGNTSAGQREKNSAVERHFNHLWAEEKAEFLHVPVRGLCNEYIDKHARVMRRMFPPFIDQQDIDTEENNAFRQAMRTYEPDRRASKDSAFAEFPTYLFRLQSNVASHLDMIRNSTRRASDALRKPHASLHAKDASGESYAFNWADLNLPDDHLADTASNEQQHMLLAAFGKVLGQLNRRERLVLTLRLGLKIPDASQAANDAERQEMESFRMEVEAIRDGIDAMRKEKRDAMDPEARARWEEIDARDLPGFKEISGFLRPLNSKGKVVEGSDYGVTIASVQQTQKVGIKKLIRLARQHTGAALDDWEREAAIIDSIYDEHWGRGSNSKGNAAER